MIYGSNLSEVETQNIIFVKGEEMLNIRKDRIRVELFLIRGGDYFN